MLKLLQIKLKRKEERLKRLKEPQKQLPRLPMRSIKLNLLLPRKKLKSMQLDLLLIRLQKSRPMRRH